MIVRIFRVWVKEGCADDWQRMVETHSIPWMREQSGCISFYPGKPLEGDGREFSMTSVWESLDAIRASVGQNWREAILFGEETKIAERVEMHHYEVFDAAGD
jgi:quinol monooxygenase YgiN